MLCVATSQGLEDGGELDVCVCWNEMERRGKKVGESEKEKERGSEKQMVQICRN